jgi:hypothetical protein
VANLSCLHKSKPLPDVNGGPAGLVPVRGPGCTRWLRWWSCTQMESGGTLGPNTKFNQGTNPLRKNLFFGVFLSGQNALNHPRRIRQHFGNKRYFSADFLLWYDIYEIGDPFFPVVSGSCQCFGPQCPKVVANSSDRCLKLVFF